MKGDFTRSTFRPQKHYTSVRMQQGRVQLDADWNEQMDITARRIGIGTSDITGRYAVPFQNPGFLIGGGAVPSIGKGHLYLDDGFLIENDKDILITEQDEFLPDYPLPTGEGDYIAYLTIWERHVTALEDELIREVALGGPDTTTRTQTVWQVQLLGPLTLANPLTCSSDLAGTDWDTLVKSVPGKLRARTAPGTEAANLCEVPAGAGYRRLENQLYRVEIHTPGTLGVATFKWSRDNGSIVTAWSGQDGYDLIVTNPGRDQILGFAAGQTVELIDDDRELRGEPGVLAKLSKVEGEVLTLDPSAPVVDLSTFGRNPKIRRWDSDLETSTGILTGKDWMPLEDGVEVYFEDNCDYRTGDYWMIPARTAKSDVEWSADETDPAEPAAVLRQGIQRHYCKLATLHFDGTTFTVTGDCRPKFPPLTMLTSLYYVGGDGQEAMPGDELPQLLEVRVACGGWVLEGATVEFTAEGNGRLAASQGGTSTGTADTLEVDTGSDGVARCAWKPDANLSNASQQVIALLIDADGNRVRNELGDLVHAVHFTANLSIAGQVAYESGKCLLDTHTVKDALDQLCTNYTLYYVGGDGQEAKRGEWLQQPLQVRVANGDLPVKEAKVIFQVVEGEGGLVEGQQCGKIIELPGALEKTITVVTDENGIASCCWKLDEKNLSQRVAVRLADEKSILIYFNASLSVADQVAYESQNCLASAPTVKAALDQLCEKVTELSQMVEVAYVGGDGQETKPGGWLPRPLQVRVTKGGSPLKEAEVIFRVEEGSGGLVAGESHDAPGGLPALPTIEVNVVTNDLGLASCCWKLDNQKPSQRVSASLKEEDVSLPGTSLPSTSLPATLPTGFGSLQPRFPHIFFNAGYNLADQVAYEPQNCLASAPTVKAALDQLCEQVTAFALIQNPEPTLSYVGGDGQEAMPDNWLPQPLQVRVTTGGYPVTDKAVQFAVISKSDGGGLVAGDDVGNSAGGELQDVITVQTNDAGLASCCWKLNNGPVSQRVSAGLEGEVGSIFFNGSLSKGTGLDAGVVINGVYTYDEKGQKILLQNDTRIGPQHWKTDIVVVCSEAIDPASVTGKPVGYVTLDLPGKDNMLGMVPGVGSAGYHTVGLNGSLVISNSREIRWQPDRNMINWDILWEMAGETTRLLAHLVLKGNFIWAREDPSRYLDGTSFGKITATKSTMILFPTGDGRRGSDFEMWFWVTKEPPWISTPYTEVIGIVFDTPKIVSGSNIAATVTLSEPAPEGGVVVDIEGAGAALDAPATVFVPAGATEVTFNMKANEVSEITKTTLLASLGGATRQRTVTISPKE